MTNQEDHPTITMYICRYNDDSGEPVYTNHPERAIVAAANGRSDVEAYLLVAGEDGYELSEWEWEPVGLVGCWSEDE